VGDIARVERGVDEGWIEPDEIKGKLIEFISLDDVPQRFSEGKYGYWLYDHTTKT
jgi:hypothetical protein